MCKVSQNSNKSFRRSCAYKVHGRMDGRMDEQTGWFLYTPPPQTLFAGGIIRQWCIWDFRFHTLLPVLIALESYHWTRKQSTLYVGYGYFLLTSFLCHHRLSMELHYNCFLVCTLLLRWLQNIHTAGSVRFDDSVIGSSPYELCV
jgi:hypothetical protein